MVLNNLIYLNKKLIHHEPLILNIHFINNYPLINHELMIKNLALIKYNVLLILHYLHFHLKNMLII